MQPFKGLALLLALACYGHPLEVEHPHSYSVFKRGVMLGDVSYSYASTDVGGRYKTLTVIKNVSVPKPTSMMISDRTEHFYETIDNKNSKQRAQVEYWPAKEDNVMKHHEFQRVVPKLSSHAPETKELPQEDMKHPIDLLELAKSARKTLKQRTNGVTGGNTGPVTFPMDAIMRKKNNGVVSVAKEYTSVLTNDAKERKAPPTTGHKLKTKVQISGGTKPSVATSTFDDAAVAPVLKHFEQSEFVYNPKTRTFEYTGASNAPEHIQKQLRNSPYEYQDPSAPDTVDFTLYGGGHPILNVSSELLFSELANAVASKNISMIKSLAAQLEGGVDFIHQDFESLKTDDYGGPFERTPASEAITTTMGTFDFGYDSAETTTNAATTQATESPTTVKKMPLRYIAPRLRGIKRFSSKKQ